MTVAPTDLLGTWTLDRRVHDRLSHQRGRVRGAVEFTLSDGVVRWVEHGVFSWDGAEFDVSRELHVVAAEGGWMVRFLDGRDFHPWLLGRAVQHPCRADVYCGHLDVNPAGTRVRMIWDVTGPAKDQRLYSRLDRISEPVEYAAPTLP